MRAALQEKIQEGDFLTAISLCLECQHLITECKDFECLAGMNAAIKVHYNEVCLKTIQIRRYENSFFLDYFAAWRSVSRCL